VRRREFLKLAAGAVGALPFAARAQAPGLPVVAYLSAGTPAGDASGVVAFVKALAQAGYVDGKTIRIEQQFANNQYDKLPSMAADLVRRQVTVIAGLGTPAAVAARAATATIPIVFTTIGDPVQLGFVASLNRPGGNATGVTLLSVEVGPKLLEMLRSVVPSATTIALLINPTNPNSETQAKSTLEAARRLGVELLVLHASTQGEFETAFARLRDLKAGGLIIAQDVFFNSQGAQLAALTIRYGIPAIYLQPDFAAAGGLISYGASRADAWHEAGLQVARILKGAKPAELPVMQATRFELRINLKTAKALGLTLPQSLLAGADEVIE
jgi:putative ABC transport system substrate-binding protein